MGDSSHGSTAGGGKKKKKGGRAEASVPAAALQQQQLAAEYRTRREDVPVKLHGMNKDILWHVLYDDDLELIRDLALPASIRAQQLASGGTDITLYASGCQNLTCMRTIFFCLLAMDPQLREDLVSRSFCDRVWTSHGRAAVLDHYKAEQFYKTLLEDCIHVWMRKEQDSCSMLLDSIRNLYLCS